MGGIGGERGKEKIMLLYFNFKKMKKRKKITKPKINKFNQKLFLKSTENNNLLILVVETSMIENVLLHIVYIYVSA